MAKKKKEPTYEEHRANVVERMCRAKSLAEKYFPGTTDHEEAVREFSFRLRDAEENGDSEEDLLMCVDESVEDAKAIYKTDSPTAEQVFDVFSERFDDEDDDDE